MTDQPIIVALTEAELRIARWVGEQRYAHAIKHDRDPGEGPSKNVGDASYHIRGATCEMAGSFGLNVNWRPAIGQINQRDIGGAVDVRSTVFDGGRMCVRPADGDDTPMMLVVIETTHKYRLAGWRYARDAKRLPLVATGTGDRIHFVNQADLWLDWRALRDHCVI